MLPENVEAVFRKERLRREAEQAEMDLRLEQYRRQCDLQTEQFQRQCDLQTERFRRQCETVCARFEARQPIEMTQDQFNFKDYPQPDRGYKEDSFHQMEDVGSSFKSCLASMDSLEATLRKNHRSISLTIIWVNIALAAYLTVFWVYFR